MPINLVKPINHGKSLTHNLNYSHTTGPAERFKSYPGNVLTHTGTNVFFDACVPGGGASPP